MDPLTALSLAANILQFIDYARQLVSGSLEIYKSTTGLTEENEILEAITEDVRQRSEELLDASAFGSSNASQRLKTLAARSKTVAEIIMSIVGDLKRDTAEPSKLHSFVDLMRSKKKGAELKKLTDRIDKLQTHINADLSYIICDHTSDVLKALRRIEDADRRMEIRRATDIQQLKDEVLACLTSSKADAELTSTRILNLVHGARANSVEQALLVSLSYKLMRDRFTQITSSAPKTFDWIFDSPNFMDWMENDSGIFWISGKAGSGKSTLMKYVCDHERTEQAAQKWSEGKELIAASFFFWAAGTELQKSQPGLLRSLLYEILRQCPQLISLVCSDYSASSSDWISDSWSISDLEGMVSKIQLQHQQYLAVKFIFFIDGLDEFGGEFSDLIDILQGLASHPNIKICATSRPNFFFKDAFGQNSQRHFVLEDYTRNDIQNYVTISFGKNPRFQNRRELYSEENNFIQEVVDRAQGVFLWVVLVSRSLLKGFTNADTIADLRRRLQELPPDLEGVFRQMFNRIEPGYQEQTARIFLIALIAPELSLIALSFIGTGTEGLESLPDIQAMEHKPWTREEVEERYDTMCRRLAGRCDGLLEVSQKPGDWDAHFFAQVVFMHKSVRDFMLLKDMQLMLHERASSFDAREALCKAILGQMKCMPRFIRSSRKNEEPLEELFRPLAHAARELEIQNKVPPIALLNEAERIFEEPQSLWKWRRKKTAFLGLTIEYDLQLYLRARLDAQPELVHAGPKPLLSFLVKPNASRVNIDMLEILLSRGASPEQKYKSKTVWCRFITDNVVGQLAGHQPLQPRSEANFVQVSQMLIAHGANINQEILVGTKLEAKRDLFLNPGMAEHAVPDYQSVKSLFEEKYGKEEFEKLVQRAAPKRSGFSLAILGWKII